MDDGSMTSVHTVAVHPAPSVSEHREKVALISQTDINAICSQGFRSLTLPCDC